MRPRKRMSARTVSIAGVGDARAPAELADRADKRVDFHRSAALQVLQHRGLVRADGRQRPQACAPAGCGTARRAPRQPPAPRASSLRPAGAPRCPRRFRPALHGVSAEIGLKQRFPHSFTQISSRMRGAHGRAEARGDEQPGERQGPLAARSIGLTEGVGVAVDMPANAGVRRSPPPDRRRSRWRAPAPARTIALRPDRPPPPALRESRSRCRGNTTREPRSSR